MNLNAVLNQINHKKIFIIIGISVNFFVGIYIYLNQITEFNKNRIQNSSIKQLLELENIDKNKFDIIALYLLQNESIKNYYYETINLDGKIILRNVLQ
jgi:hypothetical protein